MFCLRGGEFRQTLDAQKWQATCRAHSSDGNLYIIEYKGGAGELGPGQMDRPWVDKKIQDLQKQRNPWGDKFADALREGKLRGIQTETPYAPGKGTGETTVGKTWDYSK